MKWTKITENYADKYIQLVEFIFDLIEEGRVKIRIMFTQNRDIPPQLDEYKIDNEYFMLYYQFIKHAFGLRYWRQGDTYENAEVSVYIDDPPQSGDKWNTFRDYISSLSKDPIFSRAGVRFVTSEIARINSKEHSLMQVLDIILGSMQSRLNEVHTKPQPPLKRRGKRTKAKELVYKAINARIRRLYPGFNVGVSTAAPNKTERWSHPYRHWCFVPTDSVQDNSRAKRKKPH